MSKFLFSMKWNLSSSRSFNCKHFFGVCEFFQQFSVFFRNKNWLRTYRKELLSSFCKHLRYWKNDYLLKIFKLVLPNLKCYYLFFFLVLFCFFLICGQSKRASTAESNELLSCYMVNQYLLLAGAPYLLWEPLTSILIIACFYYWVQIFLVRGLCQNELAFFVIAVKENSLVVYLWIKPSFV